MAIVKDFLSDSGAWVTSFTDGGLRYNTRAYSLWLQINTRCSAHYQEKYPTYKGVTNEFKSFQSFADWCQNQTGYMNKEENGRFWCLDKDILSYGNKEYKESTCCFVPNEVNCLFTFKQRTKSPLPVGVHKHKNKYRATCCDGEGISRHIGLFSSPEEAHLAWCKTKSLYMHDVVERWRNSLDNRVSTAIINFANDLYKGEKSGQEIGVVPKG